MATQITHYTIVNAQGETEQRINREGETNFKTAVEQARRLVKSDGKPRWVVAHVGDEMRSAREIRMAATGSGRTTSYLCGPHRVPFK